MSNRPSVNWQERYDAALIITVKVKTRDTPGTLGNLLTLVGEMKTPIGNVRLVEVSSQFKTREIQMFFKDQEHMDRTLTAMGGLDNVELVSVVDEVLEIHRGGPIKTVSRVPLDSIMDLRMVYTPGVASVCELIAEDPREAWDFTGNCNRIAIVTNGTAVLGLGDIGPLASLPVMEGKAAILAKFVGISANPFLIESKDVDEIVDIVRKCASSYGAIQLEDIAAPACFEVERKLQEQLDIPVFHDDQHGTATVCVGGLIKALEITGRKAADVKAVVLGAGAAGIAITRFLLDFGIGDVVLCDSAGALFKGRTSRMNPYKTELAEITNKDGAQGPIGEVIKGRDLFVGVSKPNQISQDMVRSMAKDPIVFALANPVSEIRVHDAFEAGAAVALDGRGMNNALAYPGLFRGALDAHAGRITRKMMIAAAQALADAAVGDELLPDMLDMSVHQRVSRAVAAAWDAH